MNIVLTGFMGTGKTVVGEQLAKILGYIYVDTDTLIESREGKKIKDIFSEKGEEYFRNVEAEIIKEVSKSDNQVIATGGGAVIRKENLENLRKNGIIINLTADVETIYNRTKNNTDRPLLNKPDPKSEIKRLLEFREKYYRKCDFRVTTDNKKIEEIVKECIDFIEKKLLKK